MYYCIIYDITGTGCTPYRGGEATQGTELGEGGRVHGGWAELKAMHE